MDNLKELMKKTKKYKFPKYGKKDKLKLIKQGYAVAGYDTILTIEMEELSELIDVVVSNMNYKTNYIHTVEEIVDVQLGVMYLKHIFNVKDSDLHKPKKKVSKKKKYAFRCIGKLAKCQQNISKIIRNKPGATDKVIETIDTMNEAIAVYKDVFKIKNSDLERMESIKFHRLEERIKTKSFT